MIEMKFLEKCGFTIEKDLLQGSFNLFRDRGLL